MKRYRLLEFLVSGLEYMLLRGGGWGSKVSCIGCLASSLEHLELNLLMFLDYK